MPEESQPSESPPDGITTPPNITEMLLQMEQYKRHIEEQQKKIKEMEEERAKDKTPTTNHTPSKNPPQRSHSQLSSGSSPSGSNKRKQATGKEKGKCSISFSPTLLDW